MTARSSEYEKLTRGIRRAESIAQAPSFHLWLGQDHLLQIRNSGYSESYKRFYFRDIQALVICRTNTSRWLNAALTVAAALSGAQALRMLPVFGGDWGSVIAPGILAGWFSVSLLINIFLGPTCACTLYTAVHAEPLMAIRRVAKAEYLKRRLAPLIEAVQGPAQARPPDAPPEPHSPVVEASGVRHEEGRVHAALFGVVLLAALISGLMLYAPVPGLSVVVRFAILVLCMVALAKQHETDIRFFIGKLTWFILSYTIVLLVFHVGYSVIHLANALPNIEQMDSAAINLALFSVPPVPFVHKTTGMIDFAVGVLGLLFWVRFGQMHRNAYRTNAPLNTAGGE